MPRKMEAALKASAKRRGIKEGTERWKRYVFGTLSKAKGKEQAK